MVNGINDVGWKSGEPGLGRCWLVQERLVPNRGLCPAKPATILQPTSRSRKKQTPLQNMAPDGIWGGVCLTTELGGCFQTLSELGVFYLQISSEL